MIVADAAFLPLALFLAVSLHLGSFDHLRQTGYWPYAGVVLTGLPIFVRLGLYRAVIRYVGGKVIRTVLAGVTLSTVLMFALDSFAGDGPAVPYAALVIYWALALIYVTGSRAVVRYAIFSYGNKLQMREPVAIYGAGDADVYVKYSRDGSTFSDPCQMSVSIDPGQQQAGAGAQVDTLNFAASAGTAP